MMIGVAVWFLGDMKGVRFDKAENDGSIAASIYCVEKYLDCTVY